MKNLFGRIVKNMSSSKILALVFLFFILYVGMAAFPNFLIETSTAIKEKRSFEEYVEVMDTQYAGMLTTEKEYSLLQNKGSYINFNGWMANVLNQDQMNGRVLLKNGHLSGWGVVFNEAEVRTMFENIKGLYEMQRERGADFLFVLAPTQLSGSENVLPVGYEDHSEEKADFLVELLENDNIPVLDLRENMQQQGIIVEDAFFRTDHHWKSETGFWAYVQLVEKLREMGSISVFDEFYTDASNYEFLKYEDIWLGSSGKRTGRYFAGVDDFTLIYPKFDTEISVKIDIRDVEKTARFEDVAYRYELIGMKKGLISPDYFNTNPYAYYGWGDMPITNWRNEQALEDKKFMLIGDSMANIPFCLLPLCVSSCDELDMRHFDQDFLSYYEEYNPDTVIIFVNTTGLVLGEPNNVNYDFSGRYTEVN